MKTFNQTVDEILTMDNRNCNYIILGYDDNIVVKKVSTDCMDDIKSVEKTCDIFLDCLSGDALVNGCKLSCAVLIDAFAGVIKTHGDTKYTGMLDYGGINVSVLEEDLANGVEISDLSDYFTNKTINK